MQYPDKVDNGVCKMNVRATLAILFAWAVLSAPASAESFSTYGIWGEGHQLKKSAVPQPPSFAVNPSYIGIGPGGAAALKPAKPSAPSKPVELAEGGARPSIKAKEPPLVAFSSEYGPGSIVIDTSRRKLYYTLSPTLAYAYPIAVGKEGFTWTGSEKVSKVVDWPDWMPPDEMRVRKPFLPIKMTGGIDNPLGAKAIYLGSSLYRIHGTNAPDSIGTAASSGCFRMLNGHVTHLAGLVSSGTPVHVLNSLPKGVQAAPGAAKKDQNI